MDTSAQIIERLRQSPFWTARTKIGGGYVNNITCPECGLANAFAYEQSPMAVLCNRKNHCGAITSTKELFPDIWDNIEKKYPPTPTDRNLPARVYLSMRSLSKSLKDLKFVYFDPFAVGRGSGCGAVMFPIGKKDGKTVYNGRIISPKPGMGKSHNKGKTEGLFWEHSGHQYDLTGEVFVTEGIIDALSFFEIGKQAIAVLSTNSDPSKIDLSKFKKITFAFDLDSAGQDCLKKWKAKYPKAGAILPIKGDWNDLLTGKGREKAKAYFKEKRKDFECQGKLALAENAVAYASIYNGHYGRVPGLFEFDRCYYYAKKTKGKYGDIITTQVVSDFTLKVHHFQLNNENRDQPANECHVEVKPKGRRRRQVAFTMSAVELASSQGITQTFFSRARCLWKGDKSAQMALIKKILDSDAPVVRQLQSIGYDSKSDCYVFQDFLIKPDGQSLAISKDGFFELGRRSFVRPPAISTIKPVQGYPQTAVYSLLNKAWPKRAAAAIAWMVAGWFVHLVKPKLGFFPFLSFYKDTQVGKSRLARFLNSLQSLDEEGLPMNKVNTAKGEIRKLAQRAGLFMALLEGNDKEKVRFDYDSILNLYGHGNALQVRALTTNDIQTKEIPFLSSLLFVQNIEPFVTKAQKERVISLPFKKEMLTDVTTSAFQELDTIPTNEFAYFLPKILKHRQRIESEWYEVYKTEKQTLLKVTGNSRISENHAIILSFHYFITEILNIQYDIRSYIEEIAVQKCRQCDKREGNIADYFFDMIQTVNLDLEDFAMCIDIREEEGVLWVQLPTFMSAIVRHRYWLNVQLKDLQKTLVDHPAYIGNDIIHRFTYHYFNEAVKADDTKSKPKKAWKFDFNKVCFL